MGGEILSDVSHYCIYETFRDLWLTEKQRIHLVLQGTGTENLRRLRGGAGNADRTEETRNAVFKACWSKHYIPINFDVFCKHGPFYPNAIADDFIREITFNHAKQISALSARLFIPLSSIVRSRLTA
jgi:hypothetical protein